MTRQPLLTRRQLEAWSTFTHPAWQPFKAAWLGRGLHWPPVGEPDDDPDTSLRSRLWAIAQARPNDLGRWVREARGSTASVVISEVFASWSEIRREAAVELEEDISSAYYRRREDRRKAPERLRSIMARMVGDRP